MILHRSYPGIGFRGMEAAPGRLWQTFGIGEPLRARPAAHPSLPLDVEETPDEIIVRASLPGITPNNIEVTTENGILTIKGESTPEGEATEDSAYIIRERRAGRFHRTLRLPDSVEAESAESNYQHGVLTVTLAKQSAKKAKRIKVHVS